MAVESAEEFFAILEKSKLLTPSQLAEARRVASDTEDPTAIARTLAKQGLISRWQAGQLLAGRSSFFLGKYRLIELLGRGGMGGVFLAEHVTMNRRVALKTISRQVSRDRVSLERFFAEARAVAALDHPNIVRAYSVDDEGDRYYLVMEYVEGEDLQHMVDRDGPLDVDRAIDYIRQAADGLDHAHQRKMVHCDIKPSNLLVTAQGVVKILDLGLARLGGGDSDVSLGDDRLMGSVDYMAPELALKSPDLDGRADIYSLGCTLYFLLAGHPPFPQGTLHERILKHQTQDPPDIREERPKVPAEVAAACEKMMAKQPEDRYQTAAEVSQTLLECKKTTPSQKRTLLRAKPLEESNDSDIFSIQLDEESHSVSGLGKNGSKKGGSGKALASLSGKSKAVVQPSEKKAWWAPLVATPQRIAAVAGGGVLLLLMLMVIGVVCWGVAKKRSLRAPIARTAMNRVTPPRNPQNTEWEPPPPPPKQEPPKPNPQPPKQEPPKQEPPKQEPPKQEPPKQEPPKQEPPKQEPPKQEPPKQEPPKQEPPKPNPEPPKKVDPLAEIAGAVELPPVSEEGKPSTESAAAIGKIPPQQAAALGITLIGGDNVLRGNRRFSLERDTNNTNVWTVRCATGEKSEPAKDVAKLSLDNDMLNFRWLPVETEIPIGVLDNCGLVLKLGDASRVVPLRKAQAIDAILLDWDNRTYRTKLPPIKNLPETDALRLQVTGFSGTFPKCLIRPGEPIGPKGKIDITFPEPKLSKLVMRIGFELKAQQNIVIEVSLLWTLPGKNSIMPYNQKVAEQQSLTLFNKRNQFQTMTFDKIDPKSPNKAAAQQQLDLMNAAVDQLNAVVEFYKSANKASNLHYRVFNQFGDRQIDLFTTPPPTVKPDVALTMPSEPTGAKKRR